MVSQIERTELRGQRNVNVSKRQRSGRCSVLEPVLEHCEFVSMDDTSHRQCSHAVQNDSQKGIYLRILSRLRDGYVKLMNEMASGTDLTGLSTFYGATGPGHYRSPSAMMLNPSQRPTSVA